ncbi:MAG: TGS domain-containing protein [Pseudanabaena sp.]|jgi:hypothetical protein|nr:bifunctional (p)ppGpp synthetase/guanosine-3',5'-bis(diphosphate) 3'-pyrophosphohydrolase [Pseudanabaena sp. M051S1SP1A06QC]
MPILHVLLTTEVLWHFVTVDKGIGFGFLDRQDKLMKEANIRFLKDKIETGELLVSANPISINNIWHLLQGNTENHQNISKNVLFLLDMLADRTEIIPNGINRTAAIFCPEGEDFSDFTDLVYANELELDAVVTIQERVDAYQNLLVTTRSSIEDNKLTILSLADCVRLLSSPVENSRNYKIRVWTPEGDPIDLPLDSTPVDFAYKIHTQVGNKCKAALVNNKILPLNIHLQDGDTVSIIQGSEASPSLDWLKFVKTKTAINGINLWHRNFLAKQGLCLLEGYLGRSIQRNDNLVILITKKLGFKTPKYLYKSIALYETSYEAIRSVLVEIDRTAINRQLLNITSQNIPVVGSGNSSLHIASCCQPSPNDSICGVVSHHNGSVVLHRTDCKHLDLVNLQLILPMSWKFDKCRLFLEVKMVDMAGLAQKLLNTLDEHNIKHNLRGVKTYADNSTAKANLWVYLKTSEEFFFISQKLVETLSGLLNVRILRIMTDAD